MQIHHPPNRGRTLRITNRGHQIGRMVEIEMLREGKRRRASLLAEERRRHD